MFSFSHKAKQYLLVALKVLILVGTFYYIYFKLSNTSVSVKETLLQTLSINKVFVLKQVFLFFTLVITNWLFEILKWKTLVSSITNCSLKRATKESLTALTVSIATPNRIGEYGAKALYYPKTERKKILLLNLLGNSLQMGVTTLFGIFGLFYLFINFEISISWSILVFLLISALFILFAAFYFKEKQLLIKGFSLSKLIQFYKTINKTTLLKTTIYSVFRYLIFSFMFYKVLLFFGVVVAPINCFAAIFSMYLVSSIIPSIIIADVAVKGGVAVFLFSLIGVLEIPVLGTVLVMWLLNMVLPAILGSVFLFSTKKQLL